MWKHLGQPRRNRLVLPSLALLAGALVFAGCSGTDDASPESEDESLETEDESPDADSPDQPSGPSGELILANGEPPTADYWDPVAAFGLVDSQVASLVFDTLLKMNPDGSLEPHLAESFERTSPTTVELQLREGVTFHDGTELVAEDVKVSLERLADPDSGLAMTALLAPLTVNITDSDTIEIETDQPFGQLENSLAVISIVPTDDVENPDVWNDRGNGTGPYTFIDFDGNDIVLEANENYWGDSPGFERIIIRFIEDADARQSALLTGQVHISTRVGPEQIAEVADNDEFSVTDVTPPGLIVAIFQNNGPLADIDVRHAVGYAVDRETIGETIMDGLNPVGYSSLPTNTAQYEPSDETFEYDPDRARELLADAGYEPGELTLTMATSTLVPKQAEIDQAIAGYLEDVGINVDISRLEVGDFRTTYTEYDLSLNTLVSFNFDPDFLLSFFAQPLGDIVFSYEDEQVDALFEEQRFMVGDERTEAIQEAAEYVWQQQPTLFVSDEAWRHIVSSRVEGYQRVPLVGEPLLPQARFAE